MTADRRRGAALFVVLVFSAFLAALAAAATRTGLSGARAAAVFADELRADQIGRDAAHVVAYRILTGDEAARRGGAVALRLPGVDVTVDYRSESARVDVNRAPVALIAAVLAAAGADTGEVEAVSARIARFRAEAAARAAPTAGSGDAASPAGGLAALRAQIDALGPAQKPKPSTEPAAIRDTSDVARAWGLSDALARAVLPVLTVSSGSPTVDPVLADRLVVLALVGGDERADDYLQRRKQGFVSKDSALDLLPVPARDFVSFEDVAAVRAVARVRVANRFERRYEMVLAPPAQDGPGLPAGGAVAGPVRGGNAAQVLVSWRRLP